MELICAKINWALVGPNICDFLIDWLIAMLDWLAPFYDMHAIILHSFTNLFFSKKQSTYFAFIFHIFCLLGYWLHIESSWYHYPWCMISYGIRLRHRHVDYIDLSFHFSSHIDSSCCMITLLTLTCAFFLLLILFFFTWLILLVVYYHDCYGAFYHC